MSAETEPARRSIGGISWALADQVVASGANFLTTVILARVMPIETFGLYSMFWLIFMFVQSLQIALIVSPMMVLTPKLGGEERIRYFSRASGQQIMLAGTILIASAVVYLALFAEPGMALCFGFWLASQLVCEFYRRFQFSEDRLRIALVGDVLRYGLQIGLLVGIAVLLPGDLGLAITFLIATAASAVGLLVMVRHAPLPHCSVRSGWLLAQENFEMSKWLMGSAILQWTSGHFFVFAAGLLLSPVAVAAIRASQTLLGVTNILLQSAENVLLPRAARSLEIDGPEGLRRFSLGLVVFAVGGTVLICLGMAAVAPFLLGTVFGDEYVKYAYVLRWLGISYLGISAAISLRIPLVASQRTRPVFISLATGTTFTLLTFYPLIELLGLPGALAGIVTADCLVALVLLRYTFIGARLR